MALARTNTVAYSDASTGDDVFTIGTTANVIGVEAIKATVVHGDTTLIVVDNDVYISTSGSAFAKKTIDFNVYDVIYSTNLSKFLAVGEGIAVSDDGSTWTNITGFKFTFSETCKINAVLEIGEQFYMVGIYTVTNGSKSFSVNVSISGSACAYSDYYESYLYDGNQARYTDIKAVVKGNNRIIAKMSNGLTLNPSFKIGVFNASTLTESLYMPTALIDGYFTAVAGTNIYKSINGLNYTLAGTPMITPKSVQFLDGFYYIFGAASMCRGTSLAEAIGKAVECYVDYDGGVDVPFESVGVINDKLSLLCAGYYLALTIGGNNDPTVITIETLSATEALALAKAYTDEKIAELEERVAALEA